MAAARCALMALMASLFMKLTVALFMQVACSHRQPAFEAKDWHDSVLQSSVYMSVVQV